MHIFASNIWAVQFFFFTYRISLYKNLFHIGCINFPSANEKTIITHSATVYYRINLTIEINYSISTETVFFILKILSFVAVLYIHNICIAICQRNCSGNSNISIVSSHCTTMYTYNIII